MKAAGRVNRHVGRLALDSKIINLRSDNVNGMRRPIKLLVDLPASALPVSDQKLDEGLLVASDVDQ